MSDSRTPFDVIADASKPRDVLKVDVLAICAHLEDESLADPPRIAVATVQDGRYAGTRARSIWRDLAAAGTEVRVYGRDLPAYVTDGVPGIAIDDDNPLVDIWAFGCEWPYGRGKAMAGADIGPTVGEPGSDDLRRGFRVVETDDPAVVRRCIECL